ncbi:hypothetical protein BH11PAT2_BH11PAT2_04440 [soil metagenome]
MGTMDSRKPETLAAPYSALRFLLTIVVIALLLVIANFIPVLHSSRGLINWLLIAVIIILGAIIGDRIYYLIT